MEHIPDEKQLEELLTNIVPAQTGRLERRLSNAPWTPRAVARHRLINAAIFVVLAVALFVAATPQGHAFAQGVLQFFVRSENDTRPVPILVSVISTPGKSTNDGTATLFPETRLPFEEACGNIFHPQCSLDEIRSMVAFPIKGLELTVDGLAFAGATGGPEQVMLIYTGEKVNGTLTITQELASAGKQQTQQVAASAEVEPVSINGVAGEYVQGGWYSIDASAGVSWTADPFVQTLRWEADSVLYTMVFRAGKDTGSKLDKDDMLYLAGQLTTAIDARASRERLQPVEIEQLSEQVGFRVIQPVWLPDRYVFHGAAYTPEQNTACLYYSYGAGDLPTLAIAERPAAGLNLDDITINTVDFEGKAITIPVVTERVNIGGAQDGQALLISNGVNAGKLCPQKEFTSNQAFYWQSGGKDYFIFGLINQYQGGVFISRLEMQRLAENLTGVSTIPEDRLDPERLQSLADASSLAKFELKAPTQMIAGIQFDHAVYLQGAVATDRAAGEPGKPAEVVNYIYTPIGKPSRGGNDYGFFITQVSGVLRSLEEVYNWGASEYVTVNGQTGVYRKMCWETATGGTDCRQELYWDENGIGYGFNLYLPGALEKEEFINIADSMKGNR